MPSGDALPPMAEASNQRLARRAEHIDQITTEHRAASEPLVRVGNLSVAFRQGRQWRQAVNGISFCVSAGQCVALVGESGSGKSVTARSLIGLNGGAVKISADHLTLSGRSLLRLSEREWCRIRAREVGYVLQDALVSLDPLRTVGQELRTAIRAAGTVSRAAEYEHAIELLSRVRIPQPQGRYDDYPDQLSGGLRQRALIATAIAGNPRVLIADEPTTALDVSVQKRIIALLDALKRSGIALILISHDLGVVSSLADDVVIMRRGKALETGPANRIFGAPQQRYTRQLLAAVAALRSSPGPIPVGSGALASPRSLLNASAPIDKAEPLLRIIEVGKRFAPTGAKRADRLALDGINLDIHPGRTLGLVGESGSGKTTLGRIVAGLEPPSSGRLVASSALDAIPGKARAVQFVYQDPLSSFDPRYTVERILGEALDMRFGREPKRRRRERVDTWLDLVGLEPTLRRRRPITLSGGQRQRISIARSLAVEPRLVVLDEPVSALDVLVQQQILELIVALQNKTQVALLFISHDLGVIRQVSHQVAVLRYGTVREYGDAGQVLEAPRDAYTRELIEAIPRLDQCLLASAD